MRRCCCGNEVEVAGKTGFASDHRHCSEHAVEAGRYGVCPRCGLWADMREGR